MKKRKLSIAALMSLVCVLLAACAQDALTPFPTLMLQPPSGIPSPSPPPTPILSAMASPSPMADSPTDTPAPELLAEPSPEIEGYWIQNTTGEGLCSDSPRIIGFDRSHNRIYIGGIGARICFLGYRGLERWPHDYGSPTFGFPGWISADIPGLELVTAATDVQPSIPAAYWMPGFAGVGGRCILAAEERGEEPQWQCATEAEGIPCRDIRGYGVARESGVEWFMSRDEVASYGLSPDEQSYSIAELVGSREARYTWLSVGRTDLEGVWVGTNGYGVVHIQPLVQGAIRYTQEDGLPSNDVRDVQVCGENCVWVATAGGVGFWDGIAWRTYSVSDGLPSDDVRGISIGGVYLRYRASGRGGVWAATAEGAAVRLDGSDQWQSLPSLPVGVEVNGVMHGVFSTRGQGLVRFYSAAVMYGETMVVAGQSGLPSNHVTALAMTVDGILVGTLSGAVEGNGQVWTEITAAPVNDVSSTTIATEEGLWVRMSDGWVQASDERVTLVAEGEWYATPYRVCQWRENQEPYCPTLSDGRNVTGARALYSRAEQEIVAAIDADSLWTVQARGSDGDYTVSSVSLDSLAYTSSSQVNDAAFCSESWMHYTAEDVRLSAWVLATEEGVYEVGNEADGQVGLALPDYALAAGWPVNVRRVAVNPETGEIWIITDQGAFARDLGRDWAYVAGLPAAELTAVLPASDGSVWFGTADAGLIHFVPGGQ